MTHKEGHTFLSVISIMKTSPNGVRADCINIQGQDSIIKQEEFLYWYDPETDEVKNPVILGTSLLNSSALFQFRPYYVKITDLYAALNGDKTGKKGFINLGNEKNAEINLSETFESLGLHKLTLAQLFTAKCFIEGGE
ncbi:hypothetical protein ACDN41_11625 [Priestia aryabhattai]|uniref:hypothetical protein n=1 Tax=Priestia aryabhattai TaxID=412384 RepID=UPI00353188F9